MHKLLITSSSIKGRIWRPCLSENIITHANEMMEENKSELQKKVYIIEFSPGICTQGGFFDADSSKFAFGSIENSKAWEGFATIGFGIITKAKSNRPRPLHI